MTTFSQMVDKLLLESGRPDLLIETATYANQTIREVHTDPTKGAAVYYTDNLKEAQITATGDVLSWTIPNTMTFQKLVAARYENVWRDGRPVWAPELKPGQMMDRKKEFWYRAGPNVSFTGFGGNGAVVSLAWYEYPALLAYYPISTRPASYDPISGWTYITEYDTSDEQRALAQTLSTNWLIERWSPVLEEGLRAKIYKRTSDDIRARTSFSMYMSQRMAIYTNEESTFYGG